MFKEEAAILIGRRKLVVSFAEADVPRTSYWHARRRYEIAPIE